VGYNRDMENSDYENRISELEKKVDRIYSSSKVVGNIVFFALVVLFILVFTI